MSHASFSTLHRWASRVRAYRVLPCLLLALMANAVSLQGAEPDVAQVLEQTGPGPGVCVIVGAGDAKRLLELARASQWTLLVHAQDAQAAGQLRREAEAAGLLGTRVYVEQDIDGRLPLATNLADVLIVADDGIAQYKSEELRRVLHPGAKLVRGGETIVMPAAADSDDWSHPYHGPDNNPLSRDAAARGALLTQFLAEPWYVPMPQVTVASGGRLFKAFGHIALKEREWPWLNSLVAINAYNGTQLWKRPLKPGFMIHRNTIVATPNTLYLADDQSCKLLDAATGRLTDEIVIPRDVDPEGVWKWMALDDGVLYALVGGKEPLDKTIRGTRDVAGWPWKELGDGYAGDYAWGYGRTLVAIDPTTKRILWKYQSAEPIDSRAMCLADGRLFVYSHGKFLAAVSVNDGEELWKNDDAELLAAIGEHDRAQNPIKGFASSSYTKANQRGLYFAGPQRARLVGVSAENGKMLWQYPHGNFQLILRDDGLYAMGRTETSKVFDYQTGRVLADLQCYRGNCTRATATLDSIFTRGYRHTGTMRLDLSGNQPRRIPLMRPACQDGVIVSEGHFYWGPWMCDCNHSLVGLICLAPAGDFAFHAEAQASQRLEVSRDGKPRQPLLAADAKDWPAYRSGVARQSAVDVKSPAEAKPLWQCESKSGAEPTAPICVAGRVYWSGLDGVVHCVDAASGEKQWTDYTGGAVRFPPEFWRGRIYVGSGDGCVYCFDAAAGEQLWKFRAAPSERRINVHGSLMSNWPIGGGVLVHDGVVYAAAGITSYDGTHVFALDAETGAIRWQNNTSGKLAGDDRATGVSVQGHLLLHGDRLHLAGGNIVSPAEYDLVDGRCLNEVSNEWLHADADAAFPTPDNNTREMFRRSPRGRELFVVDGEVRVFDELLYSPAKYGPSRYFGGHFLQASRDGATVRATFNRVVRLGAAAKRDAKQDAEPIGVWQTAAFSDPRALAITQNAVVVAGQLAGEDDQGEATFAVSSFDLAGGDTLWTAPLPAAPVSWGLAVDRAGRVVVTLVDGRVVCCGGRQRGAQ
ncbi:MAG: PQQ-binding-like beta-propeller repeat protein [Pirellulaceae bacterium]